MALTHATMEAIFASEENIDCFYEDLVAGA